MKETVGPNRVLVALVTYNSSEWIGACLDHLLASQLGDLQLEILVVDNASGDGSADLVAERYAAEVTVVRSDANLGFAAGCNLAVATGAPSRWVLLLNPDALVAPDAIVNLVGFARVHPDYGLYGGRNLHPDGSVDPSNCWGLPTLWSAACFATGLSTALRGNRIFDPESLGAWQRDTVRVVPMLSGAFLLIAREVWAELGGFDETFWVYSEDADLAARARRVGRRPVVVPAAVVVHANGASSPNRASKMKLVMKGRITYAQKHLWGLRLAAMRGLLVAGVGLRAGLSTVLRRETVWTEVWRSRGEWLAGYQPSEQVGEDYVPATGAAGENRSESGRPAGERRLPQ
ncbi:MAG: glycosyltransferase family 2 protein [Candidatus Nanopelagicales bacterium]